MLHSTAKSDYVKVITSSVVVLIANPSGPMLWPYDLAAAPDAHKALTNEWGLTSRVEEICPPGGTGLYGIKAAYI